MPFDLAFWKQWEGQSLDSMYPLERCLGGSDRGAVFETQFQGRPAAVKIVPGTPEAIDSLLAGLEKSAGLSHPALVRIFASGEAGLGDLRCAYLVMERADENLAEVLAERLLTTAETREMLLPVLGALQYLKAQGFAHGRLQPANILAFGDQLKISSDHVMQGGDCAVDCGAIGTLLKQVLGGGQNARLPKPFAEIAANCLTPDPAARWDVARIEAHLRGEPAQTGSRAGRWGWAAAAATAAGILGLIAMGPSQDNKSDQAADVVPRPPESVAPAFVAPEIKPPVGAKKQQAKAPKQVKAPAAKEQAPEKPSPLGGVRALAVEQQRPAPGGAGGVTSVLPAIPSAALNTITGLVRINVRVRVDSAGNVNQVTLEPPRASKYFTDRVLIAAQAWKFPAGDAPQVWVLHFDLTREQIRASQVKIAN